MKKLPSLYAIANFSDSSDPLPLVRSFLLAGIELIQLRAKKMASSDFLSLAQKAIALRDELHRSAKIIINDSLTLAKDAQADGVHLGQEDGSPQTARELLGAGAWIGLSTHTLEQVRSAPYDVLDYLAFGPVFHSPTKSGHAEETGLVTLRQAVQTSPLPVVAIGGISQQNSKEVYAAGAASVAVVSALANSATVAETVLAFREASRSQSGN